MFSIPLILDILMKSSNNRKVAILQYLQELNIWIVFKHIHRNYRDLVMIQKSIIT